MDRYSRQTLFAPIGVDGQKSIGEKHVLLIGAGALGTGNAEALVRAGVGKITIIDRDYVEWSNLQRQQLYCEKDAHEKLPKAVAAKERLQLINSEVEINAQVADVTADMLDALVKDECFDLLLDATDNFDIRMIMNDISQKHGVPWIYGACVGSYGISFTIFPGETPCLQCLLKTVPLGGATCDTVGIIAPAVGMVVAHQVAEALKILSGNVKDCNRKLVSFDLWKNQYVSLNVAGLKNLECLSCGENKAYPFLSFENQTKTAVLCGRDSVQIRPAETLSGGRSLRAIKELLTSQGIGVEANPYLISFQVEGHRLVAFQDGRVLVHGTKEIARAKTLYHRYLG
ncbi:thiazole biosynthesis adenylyltransferase ThiF [Sutcliffiella horikoshii]|uniref:thiazole biosynthesis adenylyltransferase ThiF n=1 Tax=Sutcliffiella horikoshii TaxID=79883 RepID=UPI001F34FE1A|nr:thiazole biosynthesis adenylyltransferase ThiF [Sutcliffiella horikoshii]MCG1022492.1 thiazole biosynthesis adenylyltransferase ThiF [Sutcliffiella horikoshii]